MLIRLFSGLILMMSGQRLLAQTVAKINCLQPFEIRFSGHETSRVENIDVSYEHHDDHTFWYKLTMEENAKFSYEITALDDKENFDVYFYAYDGNNFCRSYIQENLDLISFEKNLDLKVGKSTTYYLGLYPLSPGGCGHTINFSYGESTVLLQSENLEVNCFEKEVVTNAEPVIEDEMVLVKGLVKDARTKNLINARLTLIDPFTGHQQQFASDDSSGFSIKLAEDGDYKVKIQAFGYHEKITAVSAYKGETYGFELNASQEIAFVLNNVYFYPNTYALKEESMEELEGVYSYLVNNPNLQILIIGHTNGNKDVKAPKMVREKGEEWNFDGTAKELSLRRALKIKDFLVRKGMDEIYIKAEGRGGEEMIVKNPTTMKDAMMNIRVEIKISTQD
jgi:outer membrane protein OmpA-like peptidoglycan-associated protein